MQLQEATLTSFFDLGMPRKTALVLSAARGVARAVAVDLGRRGAHVLLHHNVHDEEANAVAFNISAYGAPVSTLNLDLADRHGLALLADRVRALCGRIDILVVSACASAERASPAYVVKKEVGNPHAFDGPDVSEVICAFKALMTDDASIVLILFKEDLPSSASRQRSDTEYDATVKFLGEMTEAMKPTRVRINAVDLDRRHAEGAESFLAALRRRGQRGPTFTPPPFGSAEDIARVVAFLASGEGRWVSNSSLKLRAAEG